MLMGIGTADKQGLAGRMECLARHGAGVPLFFVCVLCGVVVCVCVMGVV